VAQILLYAVGSAFFPALLAGVSVILTRERPAALLLAFYIGGMLISISAGLILLTLAGNDASSGSSSSSSDPGFEIGAAILAFGLAWLTGSKRGRAKLDDWRGKRKRRKEAKQIKKHGELQEAKDPWTVRVLDRGSVLLALVAGMVLNLPGPFYLFALADITEANYSTVEAIILVVVFNLIMFVLAEVPLIGYLINPEQTQDRVERFSGWLENHGLQIIAIFAVLWGLSSLSKGLTDLLG
jgi:Sap, sulfolipid-1-addressing protein